MKHVENNYLAANKKISQTVSNALNKRIQESEILKPVSAPDKRGNSNNNASIFHVEELLTNSDIQFDVSLNILESLSKVKENQAAYKPMVNALNIALGKLDTLLSACVHNFDKKIKKNINDFDADDIIDVGKAIDNLVKKSSELPQNLKSSLPFMKQVDNNLNILVTLFNNSAK